MIILEKPFSSEEFFYAQTLEDIKNSPPNCTLIFSYCESSLEMYNFCKTNKIPYGVIASDIKQLIFCSNLGAKYIFCDTINKAKTFQTVANEYLLDTKIIFLANSLDDIEKIAKYYIDGIKLKGTK